MSKHELGVVCGRFFDAIEQHDSETIRSLLADGALQCRNGGAQAPLMTSLEPDALRAMERAIGRHRYEDVRQVVGADAVARQHRVRSVLPSGGNLDIEACVVVRFDQTGKITRLDEYFDSAAVRS